MRAAFPVVLLGIGFISTAAFGQAAGQPAAGPSRPTMRPLELSVAPNALMWMAGPPGGGAGPVNICRELAAFLEQHQARAADRPAAAQNPSTSTSQSAPARQNDHQDDDKPVPGQDAPNVDKPQHESGITGPVPPGNNPFKPAPITLEQAKEYESRNDVLACRDAVQRMRRAGATMPESLIALAALRPDLNRPARGQ